MNPKDISRAEVLMRADYIIRAFVAVGIGPDSATIVALRLLARLQDLRADLKREVTDDEVDAELNYLIADQKWLDENRAGTSDPFGE